MRSAVLASFLQLAAPASAEVVSSGPNGFHIRHSVELPVSQAAAFDSFARPGDWWNASHTYSGHSSNLSLALTPDGCFCERLPGGGGVEHLRVSMVRPGERLVLSGGLGPLLFEAVSGVMDVRFEAAGDGSRVTLDYRLAGFANGGAERLAPLVDRVLGEQMSRYRDHSAAEGRVR